MVGQPPSTPAWADRYGGRFDDVKRLIDDSIAEKRRAKLRRIVGIGAACLVALGLAGLIAMMEVEKARQEREAARQRQEAADRGAMTSAKTMLEQILKAYNNQSLNLAGAKSVAEVTEKFLADIHQSQQTAAADAVWAGSLGLASDLQFNSQSYQRALDLAEQEERIARSLAAADPNSKDLQQLAYEASIRLGAVYAAQKFLRFDDAAREFKQGEAIAENSSRSARTRRARPTSSTQT